jgi:N-acetylglucosamine-6-sulfatase
MGGPARFYPAPAVQVSRPPLAAALLVVALAMPLLSGCDDEDSPEEPFRDSIRPNIVVVMTDDQDISTYQRGMPVTQRALGDNGTTFRAAVATTPLCCPSRAAFLTGQYGHNNGVLTNSTGYRALVDPRNVLPTWLKRDGYRTAVIGKWLNGYTRSPGTEDGRKPAPGWDKWITELSTHYYDYTLTIDRRARTFGSRDRDYLNSVLTSRALRFIRSSANGGGSPFFLWLPYAAPHRDASAPEAGGACGREGLAVPAPRDVRRSGPVSPPQSPAVNEADVSDKTAALHRAPPLDSEELGRISRAYGCELASLRSVDRAVGRITDQLRRLGELDRTLLVFTSDNGFMHGEHRLAAGKNLPYTAAARVPLVIRPPAATSPATGVSSGGVVANIDLTATLLDYADADPCVRRGSCRPLDGLSLRPLLEGRTEEWPADRAIELESEQYTNGICRWRALRSDEYLFARFRPGRPGGCHGAPRLELYDLNEDPYELENVAEDPDYAEVRDDLATRLDELKDCSGEECR